MKIQKKGFRLPARLFSFYSSLTILLFLRCQLDHIIIELGINRLNPGKGANNSLSFEVKTTPHFLQAKAVPLMKQEEIRVFVKGFFLLPGK